MIDKRQPGTDRRTALPGYAPASVAIRRPLLVTDDGIAHTG